jgi:hypothetical protein
MLGRDLIPLRNGASASAKGKRHRHDSAQCFGGLGNDWIAFSCHMRPEYRTPNPGKQGVLNHDGTTHPGLTNLIRLSVASGLSLGYLSALAARHQGVPAPKVSELDGRFAVLPPTLQQGILTAFENAESLHRTMPSQTWNAHVPNERLEAKGWRAGESDERKKK